MSFDIIVSNLCISILFREIETDIPCPIKITGATGVLIRIRGTFDKVVNHSGLKCLTPMGQFRGE
jgi:hypothetical protein